MRYLIIPDIHDKVDAAQFILDEHKHDYAIFLGDYFDSFGGSPEQAKSTALWLKKTMASKENAKFLWGNHDLAYYSYANFFCPGWTPEKQRAIASVGIEWDQLKLHAWADRFLCSHAGLHFRLIAYRPELSIQDTIDLQCQEALGRLPMSSPLLEAGKDRGGKADIGGIVWCDWSYLPYTQDLPQIVGHSCEKYPRVKQFGITQNICIDTNLKWIAIVENDKVEVVQSGV